MPRFGQDKSWQMHGRSPLGLTDSEPCQDRGFLSKKTGSKTGAVQALFPTVQAGHPLTNPFSSAKALCLVFIISTLVPAHGQTFRPRTGEPTHAECQRTAAPDKAQAVNLVVNKAKTRFTLHEGLTSFVIPLSSPDQQRCFTLENEGAAAKGTFSIATANRRLAPNDANWNVVAGTVRFRQKRQFYLSLVGVDAKFLRLTFQVDGPGKITRTD